MALSLIVRKVESVSVNCHSGRALALAEADFRLWSIARTDWSRPLESKLKRFKFYRIGTTTDATPLEDGSYPENGTAWVNGWTNPNDHPAGTPAEKIKQLIRTSHAYVENTDRWPTGWVSIQHPDARSWFLDAVRAGPKYRLRPGLGLLRESEEWSMKEPRTERAQAFASGHPLFFHIDYAEFVSR